ncbi:MAG: BtpA/SgcQ family protein [Gemmatimonadetes bacterium]|nr:BtpA/SgcQ family protein [Gemmatimonadota bacterium]MDA1103786.1 BtpA/SgcQ family protein [Gemmatimonadota bacterium]
MTRRGISCIWPGRAPLIGMIHLLPLPGAPRWGGSMQAVIAQAVSDAQALTEAGFDGLMVENYADIPFFSGRVPPETVSGITAAVLAVRAASPLPVGVNVLRNDASAAIAIAVVTGATFVRVNVHVGSMWTDQGLIEGKAAETLRRRAELGAEVSILADVHVKHATPPTGSDLAAAASDTWHRGLADALIVSGIGTGVAASAVDFDTVRSAVPDAPILAGSGVSDRDVADVLDRADGAIIGSSVMFEGLAGSGIDGVRARALAGARG